MVSNKDELLLRLKLLDEAIGDKFCLNNYKNYESTREEIFKEIEEQENIINGTKPKQILIDEFE